jgi:glycosyltransferase involved in cell wall biosynthesis
MKIGYVMQEGGPDVRQLPRTGPANHVLKVFAELQRLGHDVRLLARWDGVIWKSDDLVTYEPVVVRDWDSGPRRALERLVRGLQARLALPYLNLFESLRFASACRQELGDRDVYYERMGWMGYGAGLWSRRSGIPLVLEVNNGDFVTELEMLGVAPTGFQRWLAVRLMAAAVGRGRMVVATGEGHRRRFIEHWRVTPDTVVTIENGSELVELLDRGQLGPFTGRSRGSAPVEVVFVGAFEPWHGVLKLLEAMEGVVAAGANVHLVLIGSGTLQRQIREFIDARGLAPHVTMTGQLPIDQVAARLAHADIGAAPYCGWMEYSGLKLFDYKAAGLAIIASGENGQPDTLSHERTALIVPPCDVQALAAGIVRLAGDEALRRSMGHAGRLEAEEQHSWRHTALQLQGVFERVTRGR